MSFGHVVWQDLTISNADEVRDFYSSVVGWTVSPCDMGDYNDYTMMDSEGEEVAGVCHLRGVNMGIPPVWMLYVAVEDLDEALAKVALAGGSVVTGVRDMGSHRMAVIKDPAGAMLALSQETE